jgi:hypothetical protein
MKELKAIALITALFLLGAFRVAALECDRLQNSSSDELVSYLDQIMPNRENAECITFAIDIGNRRYEPAIPVLTKLFDFRWPLNARQKQRPALCT